ncbi:MAG TPA: recombination protein RecR, partial [Proteobacteria bacterium]|nr:recombination protein RecR [Pseudomonadota bacterium]
PRAIAKIVELLSRLPGIGEKNATRLALHLFEWSQRELDDLSKALKDLKRTVTKCQVCFDLSETPVCRICSDPERDGSTICVVEMPQEVEAIERAGVYNGRYHVLWGLLLPSGARDSARSTTIDALIDRVKKQKPKELILALSLDPEGEATARYIAETLADADVRIARIGFGLPAAAKVEYADEVTIAHAFENKKEYP